METVLRLYVQVAGMTIRLALRFMALVLNRGAESWRRRGAVTQPRSHDYTGVLDDPNAWRALPPGPGAFPLGWFLSPSRGREGQISLPADEAFANAAVVGPPGAGKTSSVAVPWTIAAAEAGFSVLTIDVKGNFLDQVRAQGSQHPVLNSRRMLSLDYTRPATSVSWNWMAGMASERDVENRVVSLLGKQSPPMSDPFFYERDCSTLRALLSVVSTSKDASRATPTKLARILRSPDKLAQFTARFSTHPSIDRLEELLDLDAQEYRKAVSGVLTKLDALASPTVEAVTTRDEFAIGDLFAEPTIMTVVAKVQDGAFAKSLSSLFINDVLQYAYNGVGLTGRRPLLLVLDEVAQVIDRIDLVNVIAVAREAKISLLVAVQDVAQIRDENERSIVFGNCANYISFNGASHKSAVFLSERLGQRETLTTTVGTAPGQYGSQTTHSYSKATIPVLGVREISSMPYGRHAAIVHSRNLSPAPFLVDFKAP